MPLPSLRLRAEVMEDRILHSADIAPLPMAGAATDSFEQQSLQAASADAVVQRSEIVFVDLALPDAASLLADLQAQRSTGRPIEIVAIQAGQDGVALIGSTLAGRHDIGAVHVLAHGDDGVLQLGSARLDAQTLLQRAGEVAAWGSALTDDADLLLYGCDVAQTAAGRDFAADLAALTGADVAASTDLTGAAARGGDWALEFASGTIEAGSALSSSAQQSWNGLLLVSTNETLVNQFTANNQATSAENRGSQQAVALDAAGNYVVVWTSTGQDGSGTGVYARRFNSSGTAITAEILVNATTGDDQKSARVVSDAAGNFVVTWTSSNQDGTPNSVYARRFNASGAALTAETRVNSTTIGTQTDSVIAMSASTGDYVIAWQGEGPGDSAGIFFRRFNADGTAKDAIDRLANLIDGGTENDPAVTMDTSGNFAIFWEVSNKLYFQRFDAAGGTLGGRVQVDNILSTSAGAAVASDAAGNFTVVYREQNLLPGIWGKGFNADGTVKYTWFQPDTGDATSPSIDMASDGSFVLVYQKTGDGDGLGVFARKYNANGSAAGSAFQINQTTVADQSQTSVAVMDTSNFVVAWSGNGAGDSKGVFVRQSGATNTAPAITSDGGGASAALNVAENTTAVSTVTAIDADLPAQTLTYSIGGGADAAKFTINASTGALSFVTAPNYEAPADAGANNVYDVTVQVSDGALTDTQAIAVTVTPVNEAPVAQADAYSVTQNSTLSVAAGAGLLANDSDPEGDALSAVAVGTPSHGTVSLAPGALLVFTNLTGNAATDTRADWSPDGSKIAFDSNRDGNNEIYSMNADGSGLLRLTSNGADDSQAAWSPDGSKMAFMSNRSGSYEIWVMNASDGSGLVQLTNTGSSVSGQPAWSPDGSKIAFTSNRSGGNYEIFVMNANGSGVTRLTSISGDDAEPVWSPDGTKIVFSSTRDGNSEIYSMNANGTAQTRLTANSGLDRAPVWSPDGSKIAFISDRSGTQQICIMDANGANQTAVTAAASAVSFPAWSPDGLKLAFTYNNEVQTADVVFDGAFTYAPNAGYVGADSFSYTVTDRNGHTSVGTVSITVNPNTAPVISSNGGGANAAVTIAENGTAVTTVAAIDADLPAQTLSYAIGGGADAAKFTINAGTGALSFVTAPNYEAPTDAGANNVYDVTVLVSDGALTDSQAIAVTVSNLAEALQTTVEQRVNTTTANSQETSLEDRGSQGAVATAPTGDSVVVWSSQSQDGSGWGVYGQRYDKTGAAVGGEFAINQTTANDQVWATVAMDNLGRYVVSWTSANQDGTPQSIYARTYAANGSASSSEFRVNTTATGNQHNGSVAMDANGNFIVVWAGNGPGDTDGIFGRRFTVTGTAIDATELLINTDLARTHYDPAVTMNASGAFAVVWDNTVGVQVRRYNSSGVAQGAQVNVASALTAGDAAVAMADDGSMVVVWRETVGDKNIYLRRYDASGAALTSAVEVNTTTALDQMSASIAMDGLGNFIVAWEGNGTGDGSGVFAQKFNATGIAVGSEFRINTTTSGAQTKVSLAMLGPNDFVAAWTGEGPGDTAGVFARQFGTINVAPVISSNGGAATAAVNVAENTSAVTTVTATDLDLPVQTLAYSIGAGADAARFAINASTGVLSFVTAPNYEAPTDAGANNVYDVTVLVSDGSLSDTQAIAVTVTPVNDNNPVIASNGGGVSAAISVAENTTAITTVTATDADLPAQTLTYSIGGGADAARFTINASTGVLSFVAAPNYEAPTDAGANNVYDVTVQVSDGTLTDTQAIAVTVTNTNDNNPVITSNGAGTNASVTVVENSTAATTVTATDADALGPLTYSISGGADAARFSINSSTGALSFVAGPDYEAPTDSGANNVYDVIVRVSDGTLTDTQALAVAVSDANEFAVGPVGDANAVANSVAENAGVGTVVGLTALAVDADATTNTITYSLDNSAGGRFSIAAATGVVSVAGALDYETATSHAITVRATSADGSFATALFTIAVTDASEAGIGAISDTNAAANSVSENAAAGTLVGITASAIDPDMTDVVTYSLADSAGGRFAIDATTGVVVVAGALDAEVATSHAIVVRADSTDGSFNTQAYTIMVADINEFAIGAVTDVNASANAVSENAAIGTPVGITASAVDADATNSNITYTLDNSAGGRFAIDGATGIVTVAGAIDREVAPSHAIVVRAASADGSFSTQAFTVTVNPLNDNSPVITSDGGGASASINVAENTSAVTTVSASDADLPAQTLSYSIVGGADQALFNIDAGTGALSFASAPDFESPSDSGANNVYDVTVQASDGSLSTTQAISVTVNPLNDNNPTITSDGGGASASINVAENTNAVTIVGASDADLPAQTLTYAIVGGADQALFNIDAATGVLSFTTAPDFENPGDAGANNIYDVTVQVSDGSLATTQAIGVTVTPVNDNAPDITSDGGGMSASINVAENTTAVTTVTAADADLPSQTLSYAIAGGADQALFNINATTGALSFISARNYENPSDAGADNVYDVTVQASDGSLATTQAIRVTVNPANDNAPDITSDGGGASASIDVAENVSAITTVTATDADLPSQTLTYAIAGGADQALFNINASTGVLSFVTAPDFESPSDAGANNVYDVTVQASDGSLATTQAIRVTVTPVNDNAPDIASDGGGASASINVTENTSTVTTVIASDADLPAQTLTYAIVGGADRALFNIDAATGVLSFATAPDFENPGDAGANNIYAVTVQASDGSLATAQAISVIVGNINEAPTGNDNTVFTAEDSAYTFGTADFGFSDPNDNPANGLSALLVSTLPGAGTLTNNGVAVVAGQTITVADIAAGGLVFTPAANANGPGYASFSFRVQDDGGTANGGADRAAASNTLTVDVRAVNDAPVGAPTITGVVSEDQTLAADVSAISDADGLGGLSYQWLRNGAAVIGATGTTYTLADADGGTQIRVQVSYTDAQGSAETLISAATAAVANVNDVPVLATPIARQSATQGVPFRVTLPAGTFTDVDTGDTLSYTATLSSGAALPSWIAFDATTRTFSGTPGNADVGTIAVRVTATDGSNASAFGDFTLAVANVNDAPVLAGAIADRGIAAGSQANFQLPSATFTDPDVGDTLHYGAALADGSVLPAWLSFDERRLAFTATPGADVSGAFIVRVTASDDSGAAAQALFAVIVTTPVAPIRTGVADADVAPTAAAVQAAQAAQPVLLAEAPSRPVGAAPVAQRAPDPAPAGSSRGADTLAPAIGFESMFQAPRRGFGELAQFTESRPASRSDTVLAEAIVPEYKAAELGSLVKLLKSDELLHRLEELQRHLLEQGFERRTVAASTAAAATGLSIGYVVWLVRGGVLVSSMLSALPAWQMIDPLPVVAAAGFARTRRSKSTADDADVEQLFDDHRKPGAATAPMPAPDTTAPAKPGLRETRR